MRSAILPITRMYGGGWYVLRMTLAVGLLA